MDLEDLEEVEEQEPSAADAIREALERIAKDDPDGIIQTEAVVEAARDPESPLHKYIWSESDEKAAYERRLDLARRLMVRYTVTRIDSGTKKLPMVNVIVPTRNTEGELVRRQGWVPVPRAAADPDLYGQVIARVRSEISTLRNKLSGFEQAHDVVEALDLATARIEEQQTGEEAA